MDMDEMPKWPTEKPEHLGLANSSYWESYERARADAAMARLRVAVAALTKINAIYPKCWDLTNGNLAILDKKHIDTFEDAHEAVSSAINAIGPLPE
jgi:hypothetical protein